MPQITEIGVRYMRRIQVRDYEPAESEVSLKAILLDGEDPKSIAVEVMAFASGEVHDSLGLPRSAKMPVRQTTAAGQSKTTDQFGGVKDQKTVSTPVGKPAPAASDIPGETAPPAQQAKPAAATSDIPDGAAAPQQAKPAASTSDIPDGAAPKTTQAPAQQQQQQQAAPAGDAAMTAADLSKWIGDQVRAAKITSAAVKAVYPKFGVTRIVDLKADQVAACKAALDQAIKEHASASDL